MDFHRWLVAHGEKSELLECTGLKSPVGARAAASIREFVAKDPDDRKFLYHRVGLVRGRWVVDLTGRQFDGDHPTIRVMTPQQLRGEWARVVRMKEDNHRANPKRGSAPGDRRSDAEVSRAEAMAPTSSPAFRRWFGESAVVDGSGLPLVVYHGTTAQFDSFRPFERKGEQLGFGIHFAEDRSMADLYAHDEHVARKGRAPRVIDVYLSVQRPLFADAIVREGSDEFALAKKLAGPRLLTQTGDDGKRVAWMQGAINATTGSRAARLIQEAGYDGIRYTAMVLSRSAYGASKTAESAAWVVFSPTQIKSASANGGAYDPSDATIVNPGPDGR